MKAGVIRMDEMSMFLREIDRRRREYAGSADNPEKETEYECRQCRDTGFITRMDENGREIACRCKCYEIRRSKERMRKSGISVEFQKKTFDSFATKGNAQLANAKEKAVRYVECFANKEHDRHNSIMFTGQAGSGKTHLGMAICMSLINSGVAVIYMPYRDAVTRIKQNILDEAAYDRELNKYTSAWVLYIDDLLKGRLTDTDVNIMYEITNYRYMNNMPVIISTEKSTDELLMFDEAIGSRLIEMCRRNIIQLHGKELNYRLS